MGLYLVSFSAFTVNVIAEKEVHLSS